MERLKGDLSAPVATLIAALALAAFVAMGGDDARQLERHDAWLAEARAEGAWVM